MNNDYDQCDTHDINAKLVYFESSVLNCVRLLTRILPYIFEDPDWRGFFWSTLPNQSEESEVTFEIKYLEENYGLTLQVLVHTITLITSSSMYDINILNGGVFNRCTL